MSQIQGKSLQECQASNTSSEFVEWMVFLEEAEWNQHGKLEYYLAQLTAVLFNFHESFAKKPKFAAVKDFLMKFAREKEGGQEPITDSIPLTRKRKRKPLPVKITTEPPKPKRVKIGPKLMDDPKWAAVTAKAKASWMFNLGMLAAQQKKPPDGQVDGNK